MKRAELQAQRLSVALSQEALAQRVGVSTASIRSWEAGLTVPRLRFREPLARHLGVSMTQLNRLIDPTRPLNLNGDVLNGAPLGGVSEWLTVYVKAEQGAREAGVFEAISMPALLQSRAYALALERTCRSPC